MNSFKVLIKAYLISMLASSLLIGGALYISHVASADTSSTSVEVGNATPSVTNVNVDPSPITLNESGTTTVTITATISDSNGCDDVFSSGTISATFYRSGVGASCSTDATQCYTNITLSENPSDSCDGGTDTTGNASGTVDIWYFADATDSGSGFDAQTWQAEVKATDGANTSSTATDSSPPEVNTLTALAVDSSIDFGSVPAGTTSTLTQIDQSTTTVTNTGNDTIDSDISAADMTDGGNTIFSDNQKFGTSSVGYDSLTYTATTSAQTIHFNLAKTTTSTASSSIDSLWGINVPNGQASGTYSGTNTFNAVSD